jgi:hypothetical protein
MFLDEIYESDFFLMDEKAARAEWFYSHYHGYTAEDIYAWLWAGEFGYPPGQYPPADLNRLLEDIRLARYHPGLIQEVWEPLGLENDLIKINIAHYADQGCPLPRLIQLSERIQEEIRPNAMRFKSNWNLMKSQISEGTEISLTQIHEFEERIPFSMTPFIPFTADFLSQFGAHYRIVPAGLFFAHFPEFESTYDRYRDRY